MVPVHNNCWFTPFVVRKCERHVEWECCQFACFTRLTRIFQKKVLFFEHLLPAFVVKMVHVHGFASLLVITVLLSMYRVTGFRNSHLTKSFSRGNLLNRIDPLSVNTYLPTTRYFNGQTTQLSLFSRSSPPVPTQSWVVQFKYLISLLFYSSWQRKLIWAIHAVVLYKIGQYLCTAENVRAVRNMYQFVFMNGNGTGLTRVIQDGQTELIRTFQVTTRALLALVSVSHPSTYPLYIPMNELLLTFSAISDCFSCFTHSLIHSITHSPSHPTTIHPFP